MNQRLYTLLAAALMLSSLGTNDLFARGFGGARGGGGHFGGGGGRGGFSGNYGGFQGGGNRGQQGGFNRQQYGGSNFAQPHTNTMYAGGGNRGNFNRGNFNRGEFNGGEFNGGEFNRGEFNRGEFNRGEFNRGELGGDLNRGELNSFLNLPSDAGFSSASRAGTSGNFDFNKGTVEGPRGGKAAGVSVEGPRGNTAGKGVAVGPNGGVAAGKGVKGAEGGVAGRGAAIGPNGRVAAGGGVRGPNGYGGGRGMIAGPNGVAAGFSRVTPTDRHTTGAIVRNNFNNWGVFGRGWYGAHPGAWYAAGWAATAAWSTATWPSTLAWCGYDDTMQPMSYNYGSTITYEDGDVYVNGQSAGSAEEYYQQATTLADAGAEANGGPEEQWLPLGVFALTARGQTQSNVAIQLALNKSGIVRGNYTDTLTDRTDPVQGSLDKKTQRVAFTVGDHKTAVFETGLYNLTNNEAPVLIQFSKDRTEQWLLVRLKQPAEAKDAAAAPAD